MSKLALTLALVLSGAAAAQTSASSESGTLSPPPLVPAPADVASDVPAYPGTPPPPSLNPPSSVPRQKGSGYQYSPYGQPATSLTEPAPEVGLMVSESLFGMLTAAGVTVLPYFLLFGSGFGLAEPVSSILFVVIFGAAPLAVAQTQVSLANGSKYYQAETWPSALTGLVGMAGVLGIYYALGWLPQPVGCTDCAPRGDPTAALVWLMVGSIAVVPLMQMAALNLFKTPKPGMTFAIGDPAKQGGVVFSPPAVAPVMSANGGLGAQLSFLNGRF